MNPGYEDGTRVLGLRTEDEIWNGMVGMGWQGKALG